ncbi:hypothetical protein ND748_12295, partial [Frankia sp. AiPs1]|nr:hypothetical protein [Frankia sp. AiPs1]
MADSVSFDRIADRHDATRGGDERGRLVTEALAPRLPGRRDQVPSGPADNDRTIGRLGAASAPSH